MVRARNPGAVTRTSWLRQTPTSAGSKVRRYRPDASAKVAEPLPRSWRNAPAMGRPLDSVRTIPSITPVLGPSIRRASSPLQAHRVPPPFSPTQAGGNWPGQGRASMRLWPKQTASFAHHGILALDSGRATRLASPRPWLGRRRCRRIVLRRSFSRRGGRGLLPWSRNGRGEGRHDLMLRPGLGFHLLRQQVHHPDASRL
jgi:hypothetical protein